MCVEKKALTLHEDLRYKSHKMGLQAVVLPRFQKGYRVTSLPVRRKSFHCVTSLPVRSKSFSSTYVVQVEDTTMAIGAKQYRKQQWPQAGLGDMLWYHSSPTKSCPLQTKAWHYCLF